MNLSTQRWRSLSKVGFTLTIMITLLLSGATMGVLAEPEAPPTTLLNEQTTLATASLHNAGFDNHDWYFFKDRYDPTYPDGPSGSGQPLLPDDDNNRPDVIPAAALQDWRLWYMRGTPLIQTFEETVLVHSGQAVAVRTYDGDIHQGGLYQIIYNTIPGVTYEFKIYAQARPVTGDTLVGLKVGIAPNGWAPNSKVDPAVGTFPTNMVWGQAKSYINTWGELVVQAQATADHITVFTYADARGGRSHGILWDTASFRVVGSSTSTTEASLHNAGFDNHDWYFFGQDRYTPYPDGPSSSGKPIVPDDDNNLSNNIPLSIRQDWRPWYMRNTPLIQTFTESVIKVAGESVAMRTFDGNIHQAGLYQMIYTTTPCLTYNFQMYGLSKPDPSIGSPAAELKVGIDVVGWHPNTEATPSDPAVPGAFPATTIWGPSHDYKGSFGVLTVTAEARASKIAAYSYAYTTGGRSHAIIWDSGSFADVTPATLIEPTAPPAASGITTGSLIIGSNQVTLTWTTPNSATGQVLYQLAYCGSSTPITPTGPLSYTAYLPLVARYTPWSYTTLNKKATMSHTETIKNLTANCTYEYIIASRGVLGDACVTWVSDRSTFTTLP